MKKTSLFLIASTMLVGSVTSAPPNHGLPNEVAFARAVEQVTQIARELLDSLVTNAPPRDREIEAARARAKSLARFQHSTT